MNCPGGDACYIIERDGSRKPKHCTTCHRDWVNGNHPLGTDCLMGPEALREQQRINDAYVRTPDTIATDWIRRTFHSRDEARIASLAELIRTAQSDAVQFVKDANAEELAKAREQGRADREKEIIEWLLGLRVPKSHVELANLLRQRLPTVCIECGKPCEYTAPDGSWTCFQCRYRAKPLNALQRAALVLGDGPENDLPPVGAGRRKLMPADPRCPSCNASVGTMHLAGCPEAI